MPTRQPRPGAGAAADHDVAAAVDAEVARPRRREHRRGAVHGPALHVARRIERSARAGVEGAAGRAPEPLAVLEHLGHERVGVAQGELAAVEAGDLAVGAIGAEGRVDEAQPGEHALDGPEAQRRRRGRPRGRACP